MAETFTQRVRQVANKMSEFTVDDLALRCPASTYKEKREIRSVVQGFEKSGEIILLKPGLYSYRGRQTPLSKVAKMWRAIKIKGNFTQRDLARLSGASKGHAKRYIFFLKREGFISRVAMQDGRYALYCLADPENAPLEHPEMPRRWEKR